MAGLADVSRVRRLVTHKKVTLSRRWESRLLWVVKDFMGFYTCTYPARDKAIAARRIDALNHCMNVRSFAKKVLGSTRILCFRSSSASLSLLHINADLMIAQRETCSFSCVLQRRRTVAVERGECCGRETRDAKGEEVKGRC